MQAMSEKKEIKLSQKQAAADIGVDRTTVYRWQKDGTINVERSGKKKIGIPISEVERVKKYFNSQE